MAIEKVHSVSTRDISSAKDTIFAAKVPFALLNNNVKTSVLGSAVRRSRPTAAKQRKPIIVPAGKDKFAVAFRNKETGKVSHVVVVPKEFLTHAIQKLANLGEFASDSSFIINPVDNADSGESALNAGEELSLYAARPMALAYIGNRMHLVCQTDTRVQYASMPKAAKSRAVVGVVALLSMLHNDGFVTGGLSPDAVVFSTRPMVKNPSKIEAAIEGDSILFEVASTFARFNKHGEIGGRQEMESLSKAYLSMCVAGRADIANELKSKGSVVSAYKAIAELAMKYSGFL